MARASRHWLRFSLRGLFVALTLICVWFGRNVERKQTLEEATRAISQLKGTVVVESSSGDWSDLLFGPPEPVEVDLTGRRSTTDGVMAHLGRLSRLRRLRIQGDYVTDAGVAELGALSRLEELELFNPLITDDGLAHLTKLTRLRKLTIIGARITDDGLSRLAFLQDLEDLSLNNAPITSAGLIQLQRLPNLAKLTLAGTLVDDGGVKSLAEMKRLRTLDLRGSKCSVGALASLRKSLPGCSIARTIPEMFAARERYLDPRERRRAKRNSARNTLP